MAIRGTIKLLTKAGFPNSHVAGHKAWLDAHAGDPANPAYKTAVADGVLTVEARGVYRDMVDLSGPDNGVAVLKDIAAKGDLLTYSTRMLFNDTRPGAAPGATQVLFSTVACNRLGPCSALVVSPAAGTRSGGSSPYDTI